MAGIKLNKVGAQVNWPAEEAIPGNLEEALRLGWEITGSEGEGSADELIETGSAHLWKDQSPRLIHPAGPR